MALVIDSTVGGPAANSYADVAYADAYWVGHYNTTKGSAWAALTTAKKTAALIHAAAVLESIRFTIPDRPRNYRQVSYFLHRGTGLVVERPQSGEPVKYDYYQSLQFPRNLDTDSDGDKFIPEPVLMAQCEQAVYLLSFDEGVAASRLQGISEETVKVGPVSVSQKFGGGSQGATAAATALSPAAIELVRPFFVGSSTKAERS